MGLFFKWASPGLFFVYFRSFQSNNTIFTTNICEKMSIQYMVLGFEPTTFIHESPPITTWLVLERSLNIIILQTNFRSTKRTICSTSKQSESGTKFTRNFWRSSFPTSFTRAGGPPLTPWKPPAWHWSGLIVTSLTLNTWWGWTRSPEELSTTCPSIPSFLGSWLTTRQIR